MKIPHNKIRLVVIVVMAITLFSGCSKEKEAKTPETARDERPLIVGIVGPETGEEAAYGKSVVAGALAAAKRLNAQGGIGGKEIKVLHYDDQNDIGLTGKAVKDLISQRAIAILAAPTGSSTFSPIHMVNESQTIFVSVGSRRQLKASGPFVFRTAVPDETATEDLVKYAISELGVNYALVTAADNEFSLELSSLFKKALGKHNGVIKLEADTYDAFAGGSNIGAVVAAIKKSPETLNGIIYTGGATEAVLLAKALKKAGLNQPIIGGEDLFSEEYLQGGDAVNETLTYTTFFADNKSAKMDEFMQDFGQEKPDRFAALAYDTFMLLADAIKDAGSTDTTLVREALISRKDCLGVTGKTSFTSENMPVKHPTICKVKKGESGERAFVLKQ